MTNPYYVVTGAPGQGAPGASAPIRAEYSALEDAFDKLPILSGKGSNIVTINSGATAIESITPLALSAIIEPLLREVSDGANNAVSIAATFKHTVSGTPAAGIGVGVSFSTETQAGNYDIGSSIQSVSTAVGSGSESFDLVFYNMTAGSAMAEKMRISSAGVAKLPSGGSLSINNNTVIAETGLGSGVLSSSLTSLGTISSLVATTADINGGTIDGTVIGATTPAAGTFSSVTTSSASITGGTINGTTVGATTAAAGKFTSVHSSSLAGVGVRNVTVTAGGELGSASLSPEIADGTATNNTLRWTGSAWAETDTLEVSATGAIVDGTLTTTGLTTLGTLTTTGLATLDDLNVTQEVGAATAAITGNISAATVNSVLAADFVVAEATVGGAQPKKIQRIGYGAYVALSPPDANTLYVIIGA
tara:strand:+ start:1574 stop:2833 length:1260 start_codon:yes stop_codon:yes gene_type:complete